MPVSDVARTRFAVRLGELTFGERLIDAFKGLGLDSYVLIDCPELFSPTRAVEIIDLRTGTIIWRMCLTIDSANGLCAEIAESLHHLDVTGFERQWLTPRF